MPPKNVLTIRTRYKSGKTKIVADGDSIHALVTIVEDLLLTIQDRLEKQKTPKHPAEIELMDRLDTLAEDGQAQIRDIIMVLDGDSFQKRDGAPDFGFYFADQAEKPGKKEK